MKELLTNSLRAVVPFLMASSVQGAAIIFDTFNTDEGHFTREPTFSGSTSNVATTSTADRVITDSPFEGDGHEKLVINQTNPGQTRVRFLSGTGTPANNTAFLTTALGEDGWIGFYLKTDLDGWTAQIAVEGIEVNGGTPKAVIPDGQWHLYEWNLDDESGGPDGWGSVSGIFSGDADFEEGSYTIDSIVLRGPDVPSSTIYLDFVAKSNTGSVADLIPEPSSATLLSVGALGLLRRRART